MQGMEPDILDRQDRLGRGAFLAASGGLTDLDPVGGLVTGAAMTGSLDKGFEEHGAVAVARQPVVGQLPVDDREDLRSQALGLDPGQDQKAGIVDHERQVLTASSFRRNLASTVLQRSLQVGFFDFQ